VRGGEGLNDYDEDLHLLDLGFLHGGVFLLRQPDDIFPAKTLFEDGYE